MTQDSRAELIHRIYDQKHLEPSDRAVIENVIDDLDHGKIRVAEKVSDAWTTHEWIKKSILLYFRIREMSLIQSGDIVYWDKIPLKKWNGSEGVRAVPTALVRKGAFVARGCVLMPSYTNIGAHVGSGTMVDTWATVGSCAQIGINCHLSGGVGIGGVLEPLQASPVIIEDNCFIGSRVIVVEGVRVGEGSVIGAGVVLTGSTQIIDVTGTKEVTSKGSIPPNSVVIPGTRQKKFPSGEYGVPCALIIGKRTPSTDLKTSLNQALRDFEVSV
ncbi:MAG: 2,3,4,5-tetrahydropyridine-2,6-dicarboxylate N-succinyltransferase [Bdellovibrionales bacterium]|nr:2,3,4,5-tetrahydropyridine-2,6-dicarboxylate N-succinyltransferase [Bdellovibrionales bacterium]